ncbi:MAG: UDP-N-acetyl-D-mannosamine dehydrogenase [Campylobacteraceae bacterium]|jgi:UDP-N-acetyl-D-mannosaminuronic acid dehydrogenase|nr:UDP-N-acetyl-D-mannosamine dehydrogenase [Campylobacteraceae bacterium]
MSNKTVSIIGLGYIGLPTAAMFATKGIKVIGVDVNHHVVDIINQGKIHIVEPELDKLVSSVVASGYLEAFTKPKAADAFIVAVPTPFKDEHEPDLSYIESAAKAIAPVLKKGDLVILESTSPVGATEQMAGWLSSERLDLTFPQTHGEDSDIRIAHCPERVLPGRILKELVENDRIVGGMTPKCSNAAVKLYKSFVKGECIITDVKTAEMCKLTENSFRDVNIAFANELSIICDKLGINAWELISLANRHPRVNILQPGCGVGGHCIAVDPWFIVSKTPKEARLIRTAREVNGYKPEWVVSKINDAVSRFLKENPQKNKSDVTVVCFGLAFKPDIDDLRESPAVEIVHALLQANVKVKVIEPNIKNLPEKLKHENCELVDLADFSNFAHGFIAVVLVAHKEFKTLKVLRDMQASDFCGVLEE